MVDHNFEILAIVVYHKWDTDHMAVISHDGLYTVTEFDRNGDAVIDSVPCISLMADALVGGVDKLMQEYQRLYPKHHIRLAYDLTNDQEATKVMELAADGVLTSHVFKRVAKVTTTSPEQDEVTLKPTPETSKESTMSDNNETPKKEEDKQSKQEAPKQESTEQQKTQAEPAQPSKAKRFGRALGRGAKHVLIGVGAASIIGGIGYAVYRMRNVAEELIEI